MASFLLLALTVAWLAIALPGFAHLPTALSPGRIAIQSPPDPPPAMPLPQDAVSQAEDVLQRGQRLYQAGRFTEAVQVLEQGRSPIHTLKFTTAITPSTLHQAMILSNLSLAYQQLGQWREAEQAIQASLNLLAHPTTNHQLQVRAQTWAVQGQLLISMGKADQALVTWQQSEADYAQLKDDRGQLQSRIRQAEALQALGFYGRALNLLKQVEQAVLAQPDRLAQGVLLKALGDALQVVGDLDEAQKALEKSLALAQTPDERSAILLSLGNTARLRGNSQAADEHYQAAIAVAPSPLVSVQIQLNRLSLAIADQSFDPQTLAVEIYPQIKALPPGRAAIYAQINFTESLLKLAEIHRSPNPETSSQLLGPQFPILPALAQYLQTNGIEQAKQLGDHRTAAYALGTLGHLYEQQGRWAEAQTVTQQALDLVPSIQDLDIAYRLQWQLGRLFKQGDNRESAIAAYDAAVLSLQALRSDLVATNQDVQFTFRDSVEPIYRESVQLLLQPDPSSNPDQPTSPSEEALEKARQRIEALQLAELDNFFRAACIEGKIIPLDTVANQNPNVAIFYPILLSDAKSDQVHVIVKIPGRPLYHASTQLPKGEVAHKLKDLRSNLIRPSGLSNAQQTLQEVYQWLIPEAVEAQLSTSKLAAKAKANLQPDLNLKGQPAIDTLIFVLDGALRNIPIAALYHNQQYLIENYAIALNVGLQLFDPKPLQRKHLNVLAAGLVNPPAEFAHRFSALPQVTIELSAIGQSVGERQVHSLLEKEFTSQSLRQQVTGQPFNVVHLATHGQFSSNLKDTFILTYEGQMNVTEFDQLLHSRNATRPEAVELLVLSACETAKGDNRATLGLAGLALRAGARATLASLWRVNDQSTADLMRVFYQELARPNITKAEALRRAQVSLLKGANSAYHSPSHWASFVLVGNWL